MCLRSNGTALHTLCLHYYTFLKTCDAQKILSSHYNSWLNTQQHRTLCPTIGRMPNPNPILQKAVLLILCERLGQICIVCDSQTTASVLVHIDFTATLSHQLRVVCAAVVKTFLKRIGDE